MTTPLMRPLDFTKHFILSRENDHNGLTTLRRYSMEAAHSTPQCQPDEPSDLPSSYVLLGRRLFHETPSSHSGSLLEA
jgi:hypothetical protein